MQNFCHLFILFDNIKYLAGILVSEYIESINFYLSRNK
ncbi:hypothetical protein KKH3_12630 [Pectobacterium actinidiae]|nr:hypothetical protein KKH3_12630 [Pectobacterium actinidiae]